MRDTKVFDGVRYVKVGYRSLRQLGDVFGDGAAWTKSHCPKETGPLGDLLPCYRPTTHRERRIKR